jgi:hypothetical protein
MKLILLVLLPAYFGFFMVAVINEYMKHFDSREDVMSLKSIWADAPLTKKKPSYKYNWDKCEWEETYRVELKAIPPFGVCSSWVKPHSWSKAYGNDN